MSDHRTAMRAVDLAGHSLAGGGSILLFVLLTGKALNMNLLLAFWLSLMIPMLLLYYLRLLDRAVFGVGFCSDDYSLFLAVNSIALIFGAAVIYTASRLLINAVLYFHIGITVLFITANLLLKLYQEKRGVQ